MSNQISGVVVATVIDINDPTNQHRVKIKITSEFQAPLSWARVVGSPYLSVNDEVLVAFEEGNILQPFIIGILSKSTPSSALSDTGAVHLPTGTTLRGFYSKWDEKGIKSVFQPLSAYLAAVECQNKILMLMEPLIEVIKQLPSPSPSAIEQFMSSATELAPCVLGNSPARVIPLARDILCLTLQSLELLVNTPMPQNEVSIVIDSIQAVLDLAEPYFGAVGIAPINLATTGDPIALRNDIVELRLTTEALGGC
jgi:hypothetical protein